LKLLFLSNGYPSESLGGTETYTEGLAGELAKRGHRVHVVCGGAWDGGTEYWNGVRREIRNGVLVSRIDVTWTRAPDPFRYLFDNPVVADFVHQTLDESSPDVVHVISCERLSASVIEAAKKAHKPVVLSLTDFWFLCPRMTLLRGDHSNCEREAAAWDCTKCLAHDAKAYRWPSALLPDGAVAGLLGAIARVPQITRRRGLRGMIGDMAGRQAYLREMFRRADSRLCASQFVRDRFEESGFTEPIRVQPYGHDVGWLRRYAGKTSSGRIRLGYVGQLVEHKGVHILLDAVRMLDPAVRRRFDVRIYGNLKKSPAYAKRLEELAAGLPEVRFCGTYAHSQTGEVFSEIDVLVVPSLWFDFPLVIHEAFASGTPVAATRLGGMAEAVQNNVNGLLFDRADAAGLASAIQRLIDEPNLLAALRAGIKPVRTIAQEAVGIEDIYREVTAAKTASSF